MRIEPAHNALQAIEAVRVGKFGGAMASSLVLGVHNLLP